MLTAALAAALVLSSQGQVTVITTTPAPGGVRAAGASTGPEGEMRRVCNMERATGSNMQQRVCRNVRVGAVQDQQTREFLRNLQRIRFPDEGAAPVPGGPNGN